MRLDDGMTMSIALAKEVTAMRDNSAEEADHCIRDYRKLQWWMLRAGIDNSVVQDPLTHDLNIDPWIEEKLRTMMHISEFKRGEYFLSLLTPEIRMHILSSLGNEEAITVDECIDKVHQWIRGHTNPCTSAVRPSVDVASAAKTVCGLERVQEPDHPTTEPDTEAELQRRLEECEREQGIFSKTVNG